jgi:hypothetical protein
MSDLVAWIIMTVIVGALTWGFAQAADEEAKNRRNHFTSITKEMGR